MGRFILVVVFGVALWVLFGPQKTSSMAPAIEVSLADLATDPTHWDGKTVTVTASVIDRASVLGLGGILIGDTAGRQILAAGWTGPATPAEQVTVTGQYRLALAIGDLQVPVLFVRKL